MLYRRGDIWWTKFKHRGQSIRLSTGQSNHAAAAKEARKLRYEWEQEHGASGRTVGVPLSAIEDLDIERATQEDLGARREGTLRNIWRHVLNHFGELRDINTLALADLDAYEGARRAARARGQTIRRETQAIVRGMRLAKRQGLIERLPFDPEDMRKIRSDPKDTRYAGKHWDIAEIDKILGSLSAKARAANYVDLLWLFVATGLRLEEFRKIQPSWLRPGPVLAVPHADVKAGPKRLLPLTDTMADAVHRLCPLNYTWKPNKALRLASAKAGFDRVLTPRDLRVWYISQAASIDPAAAQRLAGHTNIATTGIYVGSADNRAQNVGREVIKIANKGAQSGDTVRARHMTDRTIDYIIIALMMMAIAFFGSRASDRTVLVVRADGSLHVEGTEWVHPAER